MHICIIDDEDSFRQTLKMALEQAGYEVSQYAHPKEAQLKLEDHKPDILLLDVQMPFMDGLEYCKKIKIQFPNLPVIFLSSKNEEIDRILGLEIGGDDYIGKPFSMYELLARIKVQVRRLSPSEPIMKKKIFHNLTIYEEACLVFWREIEIKLTLTELRILLSLTKLPGICKTREQLMEAAYTETTWVSPRTMDTHIKRMRQKFVDVDASFEAIESVHGLGYRYKIS